MRQSAIRTELSLQGHDIETTKCTTLWGEPDQIHMQNMEQLHTYDSGHRKSHEIYTCTQDL